jgi:hypothetical protein
MKSIRLVLFALVLLLGISAFAQQGQNCIPTPSNPTCNPVVGGKGGGVVVTPLADLRAVKPDFTVNIASEGSPMPTCQPGHPNCSENVVDRQKSKDAIAAVFRLG